MFLTSKQIEISLLIPAMTIQKQIHRSLNGVQVIVNLQASCSPIQLTQNQSAAKALVQWEARNQEAQGVISNFEFQWPPHSWVISSIQCTGPSGFADLIQQEIQNQLSEATQFENQIRDFLQTSLNQKVNTLLAKALQPHLLQFQSSTYQYELKALQNISKSGIDFQVLVSNGKNESGNPITDLRGRPLPNLSTTRPSLVFGEKGFQQFMQAALLQQTLQTQLNKLSAFSRLLHSRFLQFFIWPDLMNFSKSAAFTLNTRVLPGSTLSLNAKKSWNMNLYLGSWLVAERENAPWNYLLIQNQLQGQLALTIEKGQLMLAPSLFPSSNQLHSKITFGEDYVKRFDPCTIISKSLIEESVKKSLFEKSHFLQIPKVQLEGLRPFLLQQFRFGSQNEMIFEFGP
jgi:hypothetical protein